MRGARNDDEAVKKNEALGDAEAGTNNFQLNRLLHRRIGGSERDDSNHPSIQPTKSTIKAPFQKNAKEENIGVFSWSDREKNRGSPADRREAIVNKVNEVNSVNTVSLYSSRLGTASPTTGGCKQNLSPAVPADA
ncbi:MAG: hypothetical protein GX811_10550 [Lentisphaerae bacterium]|nr:hypothetical protein [Lentisphaerota bacterium]